MTMLEHSTEQNTEDQLTLFAVDSRAKTSVPQGRELGLMANVRDFTRNSCELLMKYDPNTRSWKTSQFLLIGDLAEYSETFPRSGMTRSGECFQLANWDFHTHEKGCSLLPTPTASLGHSGFSIGTAEKIARGDRFRKSGCRIGSSLKWLPALIPWFRRGLSSFPHPHLCEWMMGFPTSWIALDVPETPSSLK
jgi:hypothetical protein